jgi:hypothetical protein
MITLLLPPLQRHYHPHPNLLHLHEPVQSVIHCSSSSIVLETSMRDRVGHPHRWRRVLQLRPLLPQSCLSDRDSAILSPPLRQRSPVRAAKGCG